MAVRLHYDVAEFTALTRPLLEADPVRHTIALTALTRLSRVPDPGAEPPVLVSIHREGVLVGAAVCTPPYPLIAGGLPAECAAGVADMLGLRYPELPGVIGPRREAEPFARCWSARTGASVQKWMAQRLFALRRLSLPDGVPGAVRRADASDLELLARWREEFADEATGGMRGHGTALQQVKDSLAVGDAALLWEVGGQPVAWASASAPAAGMSRIGPVYTPLPYRGSGYGSAVTAAAAGWARQAGAKHVVLFTPKGCESSSASPYDLANPISNLIYPRIGFRPVHDAVELVFTPAP
ncbi:MAG: N-acetyltransferase [Actinomycetota bacterium]|nr:N-acetyltransferase [Actinomycetota bacterium]